MKTDNRCLLLQVTLVSAWMCLLLFSGCAERNSVRVTDIAGPPAASEGAAPGSGVWKQGAPDSRQPFHGVGSDSSSRAAAALPGADEELWIVARGSEVAPERESPGSGELPAEIGGKEIPMPLRHTEVRASISGYIGAVAVTQQFL